MGRHHVWGLKYMSSHLELSIVFTSCRFIHFLPTSIQFNFFFTLLNSIKIVLGKRSSDVVAKPTGLFSSLFYWLGRKVWSVLCSEPSNTACHLPKEVFCWTGTVMAWASITLVIDLSLIQFPVLLPGPPLGRLSALDQSTTVRAI